MPVLFELDYEAIRADKIPEPGSVTNQITRNLRDADLVIADLSYHYPNVYYELGIRHAIGKPAIQIIEKGQRIPFDVSGIRTIEIITKGLDLGGALESIEGVKRELRRQITFIEKNPDKVEAPVRDVIFGNLAEGRPAEKLLGNILQSIDSVFRSVGLPPLRGGAAGNIHINSLYSPSPHMTVKLGDTLPLYFGDVVWSA
jgi:hypothetical protein